MIKDIIIDVSAGPHTQLPGLILTGNRGLRKDMREDIGQLRGDIKDLRGEVGELRERMAHRAQGLE